MEKGYWGNTYVDGVVFGISLILVKGKHNECVVHEIGIVEQGSQEGPGPAGSEVNSGIVTIICHVGTGYASQLVSLKVCK